MVTATKVFISNRKFMQKFTKFHKGARFHVYNTIQARIAGGRINWVQTSIRCRMMVLICSSVFTCLSCYSEYFVLSITSFVFFTTLFFWQFHVLLFAASCFSVWCSKLLNMLLPLTIPGDHIHSELPLHFEK